MVVSFDVKVTLPAVHWSLPIDQLKVIISVLNEIN
jgi:hypothetical protein